MPNYRRLRQPGGTYFFTVMLARTCELNLLGHLDELRAAWAATAREQPFHTDAVVILPDHLHAVWTLPPGDAAYSLRWRKIKARFSRSVRHPSPASPSARRRGEAGIWQRRFWEHSIRDHADHDLHLRYCWSDPVRHGLADRAEDWAPSSIHREIRTGTLGRGWSARRIEGSFGERTEACGRGAIVVPA